MTKKYRLLIDSPEYPKGTIATQDGDGDYNIIIENDGIGLSYYLHAKQVENRPTVWHEITEPEPKQSFKKWRAKDRASYYFIGTGGDLCHNVDYRHSWDNYRYLTGNYFQTEQEAEAYKARQEAIGRVTHAIIEANEDKVGVFAIVWRNSAYDTLYIDHLDGTIIQQVIPTAVSKEIALSIISSHKEDLDLIFNVKK